MTQYRYVGDHAIITDSGVPVAPGEFIDLTDEALAEPVTQDLVNNGQLIPAEESTSGKSKSAKATTKEES